MKLRNEFAQRHELVETVRHLADLGLTPGLSGNVSVRTEEGYLLTPSGVHPADLAPEKCVFLDFSGQFHGDCRPTSEWRLHRDLLVARPDFGAVVHTHSPYATALSITRNSLPAVHYMIAAAMTDRILCAPYALFGSQALSEITIQTLGTQARAVLLANHGVVTGGPSLETAARLAVEIENLARQYALSRQFGEPVVLTASEVADAMAQFADGYGQRR